MSEMYGCNFCDEQFGSSSEFTDHFFKTYLRNPKGEVDFECKFCDRKIYGYVMDHFEAFHSEECVFCPVDPAQRTRHGPACKDLKKEVYEIHLLQCRLRLMYLELERLKAEERK